MGQLLVRNIRDGGIDSCKTKAQLAGTSLEHYVRDLIENNSPLTAQERLALSKQFLKESGGPHQPSTTEEIREGLE